MNNAREYLTEEEKSRDRTARRMRLFRWTLFSAAAYNLIWGAWVVLFPMSWFRWIGADPPRYPEIWQCVGMIVGCYGVGYFIAAFSPLRHWPIVLVGLLGKVAGPIGLAWALARGALPPEFIWMIVFNDLIWWIPFGWILLVVYRDFFDEPQATFGFDERGIAEIETSEGSTLGELSEGGPVLLVFLRHTGCLFCSETLADVAAALPRLEKLGCSVVLVHTASDAGMESALHKFGLSDLPRISDPQATVYRRFGLRRGRWRQLFGLEVWRRGREAFMTGGHRVGWLDGDGFRMPGVFRIEHGEVTASFVHRHAGERPDLIRLADTGRGKRKNSRSSS